MAALFRAGLEKLDGEAEGAAFGCGVWVLETEGVIEGVPGWPPMLEAGRCSDI